MSDISGSKKVHVMSTIQSPTTVNSQSSMSSDVSGSATVNQSAVSTMLPPRQKWSRADGQTIERLKNGDQAALETIFGLYGAKLYRVALRILGKAADSEEVIQDVFWTAYRKANTFKGQSALSTWLYRLTVNAALERIRGRKRKLEVEYDAQLPKFHKDGSHWVRPVVDWSDTPDEKYAEQELQTLIGKALDQLKPIDKSIVILSDMEDLADKEIAVTLDLTVGMVKTRLHRARLFLRGKLAGLRPRRPPVIRSHRDLSITVPTDST